MSNRARHLRKTLLLLSLLLLPHSTAWGEEPKKIKIGYPAVSYNQIHIWVAKEAGFFHKYGLDAELVFFRGGQLATQALVAGDPPIVNIGTVVQAGLQGHELVLIAASETAYAYSVVALPSITRVEQLRGKKFGVSGFGSASHNAALIFLRKFNLDPNKDVALLVAGPTTDRLTAMSAGSIDATLLTPTEVVSAKKRGYGEIYDLLDMGVEIQGNGFATTRAYIKANRPIVKRALKAYVEAIHYIHHNDHGTKVIVGKYLRNADAEVLNAARQGFVKLVAKKPYPTLKGIQFLLDELAGKLPQARKAKPEQFVDLSLLQDLEKEEFFSDLGKRYP